MSDEILNAALEYMELGFAVIPVERQTKKPLLSSWKQYQTEMPTEDDIEAWWEKWPQANVAIITGKQSGLVVVDADSSKGGQWVNDNLDKSTVYAETSKNRFHSYYTYPYTLEIGNAVKIAPDVDIRGEGGYVVAPPSIHASGHKYTWKFVGDGWDDLPEYTPVNGTAKKIQNTCNGNLNLKLGDIKESPVNIGTQKGSRNNTLASLAGKWFQSGLDIGEAIILAESWNIKNSPPLGQKELLRTIHSIHKTHYINHPEVTETPDLEPEKETDNSICLPDHILNPCGTLGRLIDYIQCNAAVSVPMFSLGASLSFLGAVLGQKVMTETGLRTNLYCISLGYSGSGKNGPMGTLPQLLARSAAREICGPTELTSEAAILSWLADDTKPERRNMWLCLDEIGQVLNGMKNPTSPQAGIPRMLTKLFTSTDRPESKSYATSKNNLYIPWHHVSMYGATTPERFWESITSSEIADGFLGRILPFESLHDAPLPNYNLRFEIPKLLIDEVSAFYNIVIKWRPPGNLDINKAPIPNMIPKTREAMMFFKEFAMKYHELKNETKKNTLGLSSIYSRAAEHASKVALIHAASICGIKIKEVSIESVKWACELVELLIQSLIQQIEGNVADTDIARWKQKIIKGIRAYTKKNTDKKGYAGATLRDLQRGPCQGTTSRVLKELLNDLVLAERIGVATGKAKNHKSITWYYAAK